MRTTDVQPEFIRLAALGFARLHPDPFLAAPEEDEDEEAEDDEEDEDEDDDEGEDEDEDDE